MCNIIYFKLIDYTEVLKKSSLSIEREIYVKRDIF